MRLTGDKKFKTIEEAKRKVSLLFMSRHMKVIQNALLYNKIEYYSTIKEYREVPLSQKLHSLLKAAYDSKYRMFGRML